MSQQPKTLDELMAEYEPERLAELARDDARAATPEAIAAAAAKKKAEFDLGVREGWWTEDGEPIPQPETDEDEEDEDAEDE